MVNSDGVRLAKRDGAVTLGDLDAAGVPVDQVRNRLLASLGLPPGPLSQALDAFHPAGLPTSPWVWEGFVNNR